MSIGQDISALGALNSLNPMRRGTAAWRKRCADPTPVRAERTIVLKDFDPSLINPRTLAVARCIGGGMSEKEIMAVFDIARRTVTKERSRFRDATGAVSLRDIVLALRQHGIAPL